MIDATPAGAALPAPLKLSDGPILWRTKEVRRRLGGSLTLLYRWEAADWIKPFCKSKRLTAYLAEDVLRCIARQRAGEVPKLLRPVKR